MRKHPPTGSTRRQLLHAIPATVALASTSKRPPNVLLIISDDHGWTDYGFMGHRHVRTPNIDRIAREGLTLTRGYVPTSLCRPSLASMMTGLYPHQHRITGNDPPGNAKDAENRARMVRVFQQSGTIAALLGKAGYVSHQSGKWWEGECKCGGFTDGMTHGDVARGGRHGDEGLKIGRQSMQPVFDFMDGEAKDRPFFIWYAPFLPHTPHNPPDRLLRRYEPLGLPAPVAKYYANIDWLDETVGQLLDHLDQKNLARDTIVVYLADNGWIQLPDATPFNQSRAKLSPYEAGVRTPILIRWPGQIRSERDDSSLASSVDLATTLLPACGVKPLSVMPGIDLRDRAQRQKRESVFGSIFIHTSVDVERPEPNLKYRWVVGGRYKLVVPYLANREQKIWQEVGQLQWMKESAELFDVLADPREEHDLAAQKPGVVRDLMAKLDKWWKPAGV